MRRIVLVCRNLSVSRLTIGWWNYRHNIRFVLFVSEQFERKTTNGNIKKDKVEKRIENEYPP